MGILFEDRDKDRCGILLALKAPGENVPLEPNTGFTVVGLVAAATEF